MQRRTLVAGLIWIAVLVAAVAGLEAPAHALGKIKCKVPVGIARIDPIVSHRRTPSAHLHQFFGNRALLALRDPSAATYTDLVGRATNCDNHGDTAAYWIPTLHYIATGAIVPVQAFTAYYRAFDGKSSGEGRAFPPDTRLVATDDYKGGWSCGQKSGTGFGQSIPDCRGLSGKPGLTLTAHVTFPSCWDGVLPSHSATAVGDTRDNAHYRYPVGSTCPAGFPNKMVALRETIQFQYTGPGTDVRLASDPMAMTTDGRSMHADFWNTWVQSDFDRMVSVCVRGSVVPGVTCG